MSVKYTALPLILALAVGGCSSPSQYYPNFKACYKDTGDANKCLQYIDENGRTNMSDPSDINTPRTTEDSVVGSNSDGGIDGSSALTGAAIGAAAGYALGNNNSNTRDTNKRRNTTVVPPVNSNTSRSTSPTTAPKNAKPVKTSKPTLSKSSSSKSSTSRGGFGSTGSKSFGG